MENIKLKKTIYLSASMFLWFLVSLIAHGFLEIWYIKKMLILGIFPVSSPGYQCYLPIYLQILIACSGPVFGYIVGQRWWNIVYVEKRHWRFRKK